MSFDLNDWLVETTPKLYYSFKDMQHLRKNFVCKDGTVISIQASKTHYCSPRYNGPYRYDSVEISYDGEHAEILKNYTDTEPIYGYVPVDIVEKLIELHGGPA